MMSTILLHIVAAALYGVLALWSWRHCVVCQPATAKQTLSAAERALLLCAIAAQGIALHLAIFPDASMRFGFGLAFSLMLWLAVCFYWIETFYARLDGLHFLVLPAGVIGCLLPLLFPGQHVLHHASSAAFRAHFTVAMLAYSLFTLAALHAILMAVAERQLHSGRFSYLITSLPPLLTMEALLFRLIGIAFILLTLTLGSGILFSEKLFDTPFQFNHKTLFSVVSWLLFGALMLGRHLYGWRGKIALRWTLAGFVTLLLAYLGSRFVLEVLLQQNGV